MLKKISVWAGRVALGLVALVVLGYLVENVRGRMAWEQCRREWAARGVNIEDWKSVVPAPVPDEDNIAMTPIFQELFAEERAERKRMTESMQALVSSTISNKGDVAAASASLKIKSEVPVKKRLRLPYVRAATNSIPGSAWQAGKSTESLDPWRVALSNDNLLAALAVYEDDLREIEAALKRPSFRYEGWDALNSSPAMDLTLIPSKLIRIYQLRAWAKYDEGQYREALEDVMTGFRIANLDQDSPSSVSVLIRSVTLTWMCATLWRGINEQAWDAHQLSAIQEMLQTINLPEHVVKANQFDNRHFANVARFEPFWFFCNWMFSPFGVLDVSEATYFYKIAFGLIPSGFFYQSAVYRVKNFEQINTAIHADERWFDLAEIKRMEAALKKGFPGHRMLSMDITDCYSNQTKRHASTQATIHQAVLACAIERHRLAHGRVPRQLDELVPAYLANIPCDPCDGKPMRYKVVGDSDYVLYSIGVNGVDDGGELALKGSYQKQVDIDEGDWIWRSCPAEENKEEEVKVDPPSRRRAAPLSHGTLP